MAIRSDKCIRKDLLLFTTFARPHDLSQIFQVDLVANSCAWRNDSKIIKGFLSPLEESIALVISFNFTMNIKFIGIIAGIVVDNNRVVDDEVHGGKGVDERRIPFHACDSIPHGSEINNGRYTCK